jgi:hypothetical protein
MNESHRLQEVFILVSAKESSKAPLNCTGEIMRNADSFAGETPGGKDKCLSFFLERFTSFKEDQANVVLLSPALERVSQRHIAFMMEHLNMEKPAIPS